MFYDLDALVADVEVLSGELDGVVEDFWGYRWIEVFDVELNRCT